MLLPEQGQGSCTAVVASCCARGKCCPSCSRCLQTALRATDCSLLQQKYFVLLFNTKRSRRWTAAAAAAGVGVGRQRASERCISATCFNFATPPHSGYF